MPPAAGMTDVWTGEGEPYLAIVRDVFNREFSSAVFGREHPASEPSGFAMVGSRNAVLQQTASHSS
jgi:hypothetical protein